MAKNGLKALLPTIKERKRYLVFEIIPKSEINDFNSVKDEIRHSLASLIGDFGMAKANIVFIDKKRGENKGLIMLNHNFTDHLRAALTMVRSVRGIPVILRSVRISGMINKAEAYL